MSDREVVAMIEPLVRRQAFSSVEEVVRTLVQDYILRQIEHHHERLAALERRYGMTFELFSAYLKERSALLANGQLDPQQRQRIAQAIMSEEEDWLDWRIARDFLEGWLGCPAPLSQ